MIKGNDGGACVSFNGGQTWSTILNQPTAQFYHVATDARVPYYVYGSQQDNTAICLPSQSSRGAITITEWEEPGGGESGYIAIRPDNTDKVFAGAIGSGAGHGRLIAYDRKTGQQRNITVWPEVFGMGEGAVAHKYRFQWTFPVAISQYDPNVLFIAGNHLFRSTDEGTSWEVVQPRPDAQRREQIAAVRRADHPRQYRGRDLLHHLRLRRIAAPGGRLLGRDRRRAGPPLARRWAVLASDHPARRPPAGVGADQHHRALAARSRHLLPRRDPVQARRHAPVPAQDRGLGADLDIDRRRHPGR